MYTDLPPALLGVLHLVLRAAEVVTRLELTCMYPGAAIDWLIDGGHLTEALVNTADCHVVAPLTIQEQDAPETLSYAMPLVCPIGADVRQCWCF